MKKYLLLIEDEKLWEKFKESIDKDINTELVELIRDKAAKGGKKRKRLLSMYFLKGSTPKTHSRREEL